MILDELKKVVHRKADAHDVSYVTALLWANEK